MNKKYYKVVAKCGHVGRHKYYEGTFYVSAENGKIAASKTRNFGRVKHDHKDAILSVTEITRQEFESGRNEFKNERYFSCGNIQEQRRFYDEISEKIKGEMLRENFNQPSSDETRRQKIRYKKSKADLSEKSYAKYAETCLNFAY